MVCLNQKIDSDHNLSFFAFGPWAIYNPWYLDEIDKFCNLSNMHFDDTI